MIIRPKTARQDKEPYKVAAAIFSEGIYAPYFFKSVNYSIVFQTPSLHEGYDTYKYSWVKVLPADFLVMLLVLNL